MRVSRALKHDQADTEHARASRLVEMNPVVPSDGLKDRGLHVQA